MPQAVTHILIVIILLSLFRDYVVKKKGSFPLHYILIGGIAGVLPDIDVAVYYVLSFFGFALNEVHRTFSHSIFAILLFLLLGVLVYKFKNKELGKHHLKLSKIFFVISFGVFIHLLLDAIVEGKIILFYPFLDFEIGLNLIKLIPLAWQTTIIPSIDATLLVIWLIYMEVKHKISNFI